TRQVTMDPRLPTGPAARAAAWCNGFAERNFHRRRLPRPPRLALCSVLGGNGSLGRDRIAHPADHFRPRLPTRARLGSPALPEDARRVSGLARPVQTCARERVKAAEGGSELAAAHARFARAAMSIYVGTAAVALGLLVVSLATDLEHQKRTAVDMLSLETQVRSHYLTRHLELLADELTRLGMRSEVDLLDQNMEPERSLLRLSHEKSAVFDVGVAILGRDRAVLWSEPQTFLASGVRPVEEGPFSDLQQRRAVKVVAAQWTPGASVLYVLSPILRNGRFTGALLGGIDPGTLLGDRRAGTTVALFTQDHALVYPLRLPFDTGPVW